MHISTQSTARRLLGFQPGVSKPIQARVGGKVSNSQHLRTSLETTHRVLRRENVVWMPGDGSRVDQVLPLPSTLAIAVMVFQLRVVTGTPKSRSNVPR